MQAHARGLVGFHGEPSNAWRLSAFSPHNGYDKGRSKPVQALWFAVSNVVFQKWWCPAALRLVILRMFGAELGSNVLVRHRVRVLWPWHLTVGSDVWIGEGVWLLNLERISIGSNVCISQEAFLCTGSHNRRSADFRYDNRPIVVHDNAWIATQALLLPGAEVEAGATVAARTVITGAQSTR